MKIAQINTTCGVGSTGRICVSISKMLSEYNIENKILYCSNTSDYPLGIKCTDGKYIKVQALKSHILGNYGFNSISATKRIISELEQFKPDIVHLHNIHGHDCNLQMLFSYFKSKHIKLFWTFHDCWAFTAYCPYFSSAHCDKWKTGCRDCPLYRRYSWFSDRSAWLYKIKKELFSGLDLTIITPSQWLADLVSESFLGNYPVKVINNGIDTDVFQPYESNFRENYKIPPEKSIILGVAFDWDHRKGIDVFVELSKRLDDRFQIILVGTNDSIDRNLPKNIISIHRTQNQTELAKIYTAADVFVNPTREENFPTVNLEAISCGTPVITFRTGGSPESLNDECGIVVDCEDIDNMCKEIIRVCKTNTFSKEAILHHAKLYKKENKYLEYMLIYGVIDDRTAKYSI